MDGCASIAGKGLLMELRKFEEEKQILLVKIQRLEFKLRRMN